MRQLTHSLIISFLVISSAGYAKPFFYQPGKSIEQCEQDLLECLYSGSPVDLCMQARGYRYLDFKRLPKSKKRKKVRVLFEEYSASGNRKAALKEYWIMDGSGMTSRSARFFR